MDMAHETVVLQQMSVAGLRGLWLPVPDGAVGQDVAVGAPPLDPAAFELVLVQRRVHAALA